MEYLVKFIFAFAAAFLVSKLHIFIQKKRKEKKKRGEKNE